MAQYEMNLRDYWMLVRRRRLTILLVTVAVMVLSLWLAKQKVQVYQATSAVKFEPSSSLSGLLVEVLSYSGADTIDTQAALIRSYTILEDVARRMGVVPAGPEVARDTKAYRSAVDTVGDKLKTTRVGGTAIIEITATSTNPREAADLANTVAEVYRDHNRAQRNARIIEARKYIDEQLRETEGRLKNAEDSMWAFRDDNRIISPGAESSVLLSLFTSVRLDIEKARQQRTELEAVLGRLTASERAGSIDRVVVDTPSPALARLLANHIDLVLERNNLALELTGEHPRLQAIGDRIREVQREMRREITAEIAHLQHREQLLNQQLTEVYQRNRAVPSVELGLTRLQRDAKSSDELAVLLRAKRQEALIKEAEVIEEVAIIRPATEPDAPVSGQTFNTMIVGGFLGLVLGLVLAFIQETLDTSIGTIEDVEAYLAVPVLGVVPHIDTRATVDRLIERRPALAQMDRDALASHALLITHFDPKSPVAEAYRTLRTKIQFAGMERMAKTIVVTSPTLQEGKTTTIVNLALTMAQNGQRTLLVGANLRRPSIHRFFGIDREPGLSDIILGNAQWRECIRTVADILMGRFEMEDIMASPGLDNLHIIEAGPVPANPSELLSTPAMTEFLRQVREEYDVVLIDTPPVLPVTDATIVASQVDAVVLVYQAGKVGRLVLKRAKVHLESAHAHVLGVVLNDVQTEVAGYQYVQYYTHYYGEESGVPGPEAGVARLWHGLRARVERLRGRRPRSRSLDDHPPDDDLPRGARDRRRRGRGYRNTRLGVLLLGALAATLGGVVAYRAGLLHAPASLRPRDALRERMSGGANPTPSAVTPGESRPRSSTPGASGPPSAGTGREESHVAAVAPSTPSSGATATAANSVVPQPPAVTATPAPLVTATSSSLVTAAPAPAGVAPTIPPAAATTNPGIAAAVTPVATTQTGVRPVSPRAGVFALDLGPFASVADAEVAERQLTAAGFESTRVRQDGGVAVYDVLIDNVGARPDADALVATLRDQAVAEATAVAVDGGFAVRVGAPAPLRDAVKLAERLHALGHRARIATHVAENPSLVVRHGRYGSRAEADERGEALKRLGIAARTVRVQ